MVSIIYQKCNPGVPVISMNLNVDGLQEAYLRSIDGRRTTHTSDSAPCTQFCEVSRFSGESEEAGRWICKVMAREVWVRGEVGEGLRWAIGFGETWCQGDLP